MHFIWCQGRRHIQSRQGGGGAEVAYLNAAGQLAATFFVPGYSLFLASVDDFI